MQTDNSSSSPVRKIGEDVKDALRNAVKIALEEFKVATPEQKPEAAKRLSDALRSFVALLEDIQPKRRDLAKEASLVQSLEKAMLDYLDQHNE
jgi:hypothetical protein